MKNEDPIASSEGRHETGLGAMPESPAQAASVLSDVDALISEIENAPAGSEALDSRIHFGFRVAMERCPDIGELLFREGISWFTAKQVLDAQIPPFTTTLDASLEGEDITFVVHAIRQGKWGAMQRTHHGEEVLAWASTEPMARRLAAIKAWRAHFARAAAEVKLRTGTPEENQPSPAAPAIETPRPASIDKVEKPEERPAEVTADEKKDWEVLF
ncbi:MAG: hypothetical protein V3R85_02720 [Alphaproteobacteria bacterium]